MALGLLVASLLSWAGLAAAALYGHWHAATHSYALKHFNLAMPAAFLSMFSHCMTFFYFIGMAKQVKDWCARYNLDPGIVTQLRGFRSRVSPYITAAIVLTMAATILGGGAATTRGWLATLHGALAYAALAVNALTIYIEYRYLVANNLVVEDALRVVTGGKP